jgi:glucose/arabinose dehydrogenase
MRIIMSGTCAAALALSIGSAVWSQQPPAAAAPARPAIPQFPPGPDYAGVSGTAAEEARITAICGPNRNAKDGYAPAPAFPGQTKAPLLHSKQGYAVEEFARIDRPWGMAFLPDGKMLISFRNGGMRTVDTKGVVSDLLTGVPQIYQQRIGTGMYDVILDRDFKKNRTIYFTYHTKAPTDATPMGRIASARLSADEKSLTDVKTLREGADIQARRLVQAKDGTLIALSAGDLADVGPDPQTLSTQAGKALRINTDGSIPKDNPFVSTAGANPAVWTMGFRDIHSAAVNPKTGELWVAENVPMGGDEVNIFRSGKNYGFPVISYGRQNSGAMINNGKTAQDGMEQPRYYWNPSVAPSGMLFYTGSKLPAWKDSLFIGAMSGMQVMRLELKGDKVTGEEKLLLDSCHRFKIVSQGPDGLIYLLTDENPPQQNLILRLVPAKAPPAPKPAPPPKS